MDRLLRSIVVTFAVLCCSLLQAGAQTVPSALERGVAITDPAVLHELDGGRFGLKQMLAAGSQEEGPLSDRALFALPSMGPVRKSLDGEFDRYLERHKAEFPKASIGVGPQFDFQLFDREQLYSAATRFVLAGIVNRMDRAYVAPESCGEIRLIYRLTEIGAAPVGEHGGSARLPMTFNLVLKAKPEALPGGKNTTCAEIARRWLDVGSTSMMDATLAEKLTAGGGPLEFVKPDNIDRLETNTQIVRVLQSPNHDFRTDYLLKVFDYDRNTQTFEEATLENQIDRERLLTDDKLRQDFRTWLLKPEHFVEFDRGTAVIPKQYLARGAIAQTPVGFSFSSAQPAFGLMQGEGDRPLFSNDDVVGALQAATRRGLSLQNIRSVAGFERRLNDITCAGCHQTRGIGGFHFPGVDWMAQNPSNTIIVPASPHFFGDQVRRRDILSAFAGSKRPDFSRGFSERPQLRGSRELAGTEYDDGWGAHCYGRPAKASEGDRSYSSWACAKGLACQIMSETSRMGMCFVSKR